MGFEKGHKLAKGGARPGAGRKKSPSRVMREVVESKREKLGEYWDKLEQIGDRESLIFMISQIVGKPRVFTELDIRGGEDLLSAPEVVKFFQKMDEYNKQRQLMSPQEQLAEHYTHTYGDRENWPDWAIKAVETKQIAQGSQEDEG